MGYLKSKRERRRPNQKLKSADGWFHRAFSEGPSKGSVGNLSALMRVGGNSYRGFFDGNLRFVPPV